MTDATLALMGLCLGAGSAVGWVARGRWQRRYPTRSEKLTRWVYRHLDEIIGATKHENQLRSDKRFRVIHKRRWYWWLVPNTKRLPIRTSIANFFWPVPHLAPGSNPLPSDKRIREYIQVSADMATWTVRYTPEAPANWPQFEEWLTRGRPNQGGGLAQALGLEWKPGLFEARWNRSERLVHLTRKPPPPEFRPTVPVGVNADA